MRKKISCFNLTKGGGNTLNLLHDDTSIVIREADKGSVVVPLNREDYLREANNQLSDKEVYKQVLGDPKGSLMKIINSVLGKIKNRGYINNGTLNYFVVNNSKIGRFYLPPRIHKRLHNIPARPIISNSSCFTENIFSFLDFHLNPLAHKVKYYIQDTNNSLKNMANLSLFPYDLVLCAEDVVGLYLNIPHEEWLIAIRRALDTRKDKTILTDSLIELAECVLKNNIFEHDKSVFKQLRGTAIGTKMAPPYAIIFMDSLEESILSKTFLKSLVWSRYIGDIFMMWKHGEEELQNFSEILNCYHPTITFTAEYSRLKLISWMLLL